MQNRALTHQVQLYGTALDIQLFKELLHLESKKQENKEDFSRKNIHYSFSNISHSMNKNNNKKLNGVHNWF